MNVKAVVFVQNRMDSLSIIDACGKRVCHKVLPLGASNLSGGREPSPGQHHDAKCNCCMYIPMAGYIQVPPRLGHHLFFQVGTVT